MWFVYISTGNKALLGPVENNAPANYLAKMFDEGGKADVIAQHGGNVMIADPFGTSSSGAIRLWQEDEWKAAGGDPTRLYRAVAAWRLRNPSALLVVKTATPRSNEGADEIDAHWHGWGRIPRTLWCPDLSGSYGMNGTPDRYKVMKHSRPGDRDCPILWEPGFLDVWGEPDAADWTFSLWDKGAFDHKNFKQELHPMSCSLFRRNYDSSVGWLELNRELRDACIARSKELPQRCVPCYQGGVDDVLTCVKELE